MLKNVCRLLTN